MARLSSSVYPGSSTGAMAFAQHRRHGGDVGGRGDEEDLGQVEGDVEIAVADGGAGSGVERLEQSCGGAAGLVEAVDLVEYEHRVADAGAPQLLDDASGRARAGAVHGRGVGPARRRAPRRRVGRRRRPPAAPAPTCPPRGKQSHTARYQGSDATIRYRFHPRSGERVEIVRRHRRAGSSVLVIRQPDGTLAQVPTWMCEPAAAALSAKDPPRIALAGLRDLRLTVDAALSSFSSIEEGERLETDTGSKAGRVAGGDAAGTRAHGADTGDAAPAGGDSAARSGGASDGDQAGRSRGDGGKR